MKREAAASTWSSEGMTEGAQSREKWQEKEKRKKEKVIERLYLSQLLFEFA